MPARIKKRLSVQHSVHWRASATNDHKLLLMGLFQLGIELALDEGLPVKPWLAGLLSTSGGDSSLSVNYITLALDMNYNVGKMMPVDRPGRKLRQIKTNKQL